MARIHLVGPWADLGLLTLVLGQRVIEAGSNVSGLPLKRLTYWLTATGCDWSVSPAGDVVMQVAEPQPALQDLVSLVPVVMGYFPHVDPAQFAQRLCQVAVQAAALARAGQDPVPAALRRKVVPGDIETLQRRQPYAVYFAVEEIDFIHEKFTGGHGRTVRRAVFVSGDAVTVLPYDPVRDRVLLVEQVRSGPLVRGDCNPWQLEAVAGRIDPGETAEEAALREAVEEAGLNLTTGGLRVIAQYYPSPGTSAEKLYSYLALTDLPDAVAGIHGLDGEDEDIKGHLVGFDALMALVQSGEIGNAPTILSALWLARERAGLRG
jgi:ADP-ribose pyrophosphatase